MVPNEDTLPLDHCNATYYFCTYAAAAAVYLLQQQTHCQVVKQQVVVAQNYITLLKLSDGHTPVVLSPFGALPGSLWGHHPNTYPTSRPQIIVTRPEPTLLFEVEQLSVKCHFNLQRAVGRGRLRRHNTHGRRRGSPCSQSCPFSLFTIFQGHFKGKSTLIHFGEKLRNHNECEREVWNWEGEIDREREKSQ